MPLRMMPSNANVPCIAPQLKLHRSARTRQLRRAQPLQLIDLHIRAGGRIQLRQPQVDRAFCTARAYFPRAGQPFLRNADRRRRRADDRTGGLSNERVPGLQRRRRHRCLRWCWRCRDDARGCACQREQQARRDGYARDIATRRWRPSVAAGVEGGQYATFELSSAGHADREGRRAVAAEAVRDLEQMAGVIASRSPRRNHTVVAGELSFDAQTSRNPPHRWMEPVHRAGREREHLRQAIVASDVRQFVQDHRAAPVLGPCVPGRRDQDCRPAGAEGHRHALLTAAKESHRTTDAEAVGRLLQQRHPFSIAQLRGLAREPLDTPPLPGQPDQHHDHAGAVQPAEAGSP